MKYLFLILSILLIVLIIWIIYRYIKYTRLIKQEPEQVKVRKDLRAKIINLVCALIWIPLSCSYIYFASEKIGNINEGLLDYQKINESQTVEEYRETLRKQPEAQKRWYTLLLAFWLIDGIVYALELTVFRYEYITPKGVYYPDGFIPAEKFSYTFNGDTLLLYHKRNTTPASHPVPESVDRELLLRILAENYKPHEQNTT